MTQNTVLKCCKTMVILNVQCGTEMIHCGRDKVNTSVAVRQGINDGYLLYFQTGKIFAKLTQSVVLLNLDN